ncbi:MAG: P-type conjugative transfer protein TrbL [Betaproteobacteria bacterium]|nr:P-type conjugative transfer protein TrbL [Betaproteobacteria bacterium]
MTADREVKTWSFSWNAAIALVILEITPLSAHASSVFDIVTSSFAPMVAWGAQSEAVGKDILYTFAVLDVVWMALQWVINRKTFDELLPSLIRKMLVLGFFAYLLMNGSRLAGLIEATFVHIGGQISGRSAPLTPSSLIDIGNNTFANILEEFDQGMYATFFSGSWSSVIESIPKFLMYLPLIYLAAGLMWLAFMFMAIDLIVLTVENYFVIGGGLFLLGFGGSRWTAKYAEGYINYAVNVGMRLAVLYMIVGVVVNSVVPGLQGPIKDIFSGNNIGFEGVMSVAGVGLVLLMISKALPSKAASMLSGGSHLTGTNLAGMAAPMASAAAMGTAALATGGTALAAGMAAKAAGGAISAGTGAVAGASMSQVAAAQLGGAGMGDAAASGLTDIASINARAAKGVPAPGVPRGAEDPAGSPSPASAGVDSAGGKPPSGLSPSGPQERSLASSMLGAASRHTGEGIGSALGGQHGAGSVQSNHVNFSHGNE